MGSFQAYQLAHPTENLESKAGRGLLDLEQEGQVDPEDGVCCYELRHPRDTELKRAAQLKKRIPCQV